MSVALFLPNWGWDGIGVSERKNLMFLEYYTSETYFSEMHFSRIN